MGATRYLRSSFLSKLRTSCNIHYRTYSAKSTSSSPTPPPPHNNNYSYGNEGEEEVPTSGISRPLSEILKELNEKVPDSLIRARTEPDGVSVKYIPRNPLFQKRLFAKAANDYQSLRSMRTQASLSTAKQKRFPDAAAKIFAPYSVYKGKAALSASPIPPTFIKLESGAFRVDRQGVIFLTLWPAIGERKYDWEKRQYFALSPTEVGSLISLGPKESCEFFHDPSMLSSNAGQVRKSLSIRALDNGGGYFISLSVVNNILKTNNRLVVPVTTAEFAVMRSAFNFALPHIMGWDQYTNQLPQSMGENRPKPASEFMSTEWDR